MRHDELVRSLLGSEATMLAAVGRVMAEQGNEAVAVEPMGSAMLIAFGQGRYVNRAIGLGQDLDRDGIATIERFYRRLGHPPALQLSSTAGPEVLDDLRAAGFATTSFRGVHATSIADLPDRRAGDHDHRLVTVDDDRIDCWLRVLAEGNRADTAAARRASDEYGMAVYRVDGSINVLVFDGDRAVGCASLHVVGDTAWLGGAATVPDHRGRGVQRQLIAHRLLLAADRGCSVVAATATPGGPSTRNLLRAGLGLVDIQVVLCQPGASPT